MLLFWFAHKLQHILLCFAGLLMLLLLLVQIAMLLLLLLLALLLLLLLNRIGYIDAR